MSQKNEFTRPPFKNSTAAVPDRYITRKQLVELTGINKTYIYHITATPSFRFPHSRGKAGVRNMEVAWDRSEVMIWLEQNDITAINLSPVDNGSREHSTLDNVMAQQYLRTGFLR